jgi:aspartyl-tRNA(Asn)/glutamyl-tRNA(Gln) amidotransferase subunit C
MALTSDDMRRLAALARLELTPDAEGPLVTQINGFFDLVAQMNAVDTTGIEPLAHPTDAMGEAVALRLRDDIASEPRHQPAQCARSGARPVFGSQSN